MANGGKDVRIGDDKRPVSIIPKNEDNLFNVNNGEILVDEFGTPLITEIDQIFIPDTTAARSTSIVFPSNPVDTRKRIVYENIGFQTATYCVDLDAYGGVGINAGNPTVLTIGGVNVPYSNTVLKSNGSSVTLELYPGVEVKTVNPQNAEHNRLYFESNSQINNLISDDPVASGIEVGDYVQGAFIANGSFVTHVNRERVLLSRESTKVGITTDTITFFRKKIKSKPANNVIKIEEQFRETSEVSSSLLGIPRAETQLSLFSNVSSYGLDDSEFETFSRGSGYSFKPWRTRANDIYGKRYGSKITEEVTESGISIRSFPVPYSFPWGPKLDKLNLYREDDYIKWRNFVNLGNQLHNYYQASTGDAYPGSWKSKFLNPNFVYLEDNDINNDVIFAEDAKGTPDEAFALVDTWTDTWRDIRDKSLIDPVTNQIFDFGTINDLKSKPDNPLVLQFAQAGDVSQDNTRPGYFDTYSGVVFLQSRRVFRYQPGRISGFTFGVKISDERRGGSIMELGIINPTDQYLFQVDTGRISIVRRSTVALSASALEKSNLTPNDQQLIEGPNNFDEDEVSGTPKKYHTIVIPQDKFNGDVVNGSGPSGYTLIPSQVTMFKIEFGWYGAIGARFYAYIPSGNGEARWIVLHTLVIENQLQEPCLQDSYFRLYYFVKYFNTSSLRTPQFIYKYGASYYIDGGDEGSSKVYSVSSGAKTIDQVSTFSPLKPLIGITPKTFLLNSSGDEIINKKVIVPTSLSVTSDRLAKIEVVTCEACPGFGHVVTPGLASTEAYPSRNFEFEISNSDPSKINAIGISSLTEDDIGAKLISPSIYNFYITGVEGGPDENGSYSTAKVQGWGAVTGDTDRRSGLDNYPTYGTKRVLGGSTSLDRVGGGTTDHPSGSHPYAIRLSNYDGYAASNYKLTGTKIVLQYMLPQSRDSYSHWSDVLIGLTNQIPVVNSSTKTLIGFNPPAEGSNFNAGITTSKLPNNKIIYVENTHTYAGIDQNGVETHEGWIHAGHRLRTGIDRRIKQVGNDNDGGVCCKATIIVDDPQPIEGINIRTGQYLKENLGLTNDIISGLYEDPSLFNEQDVFLVKEETIFPDGITYNGGQVKVVSKDDPENNVFFGDDPKKYTGSIEGITKVVSFVKIVNSDGDPANLNPGTPAQNFAIEIRSVSIEASKNPTRNKLFNFNPFPLYFVCKLKDNAKINNISILQSIGPDQTTIAPPLFVPGVGDIDNPLGFATHMSITNANGQADVNSAPPTNFLEVDRLSSANVDIQNQQNLRVGIAKTNDIFYVGENTTKEVDLSRTFGYDRNVVTKNIFNTEATFIVAGLAKTTDSSGTIEVSLNFKEQ